MNVSPQDWNPPQWHPDFGDPKVEFEQLRARAIELLSDDAEFRRFQDLPSPYPRLYPRAAPIKVTLETPEPGLMFLRIESDNQIAEVYSVLELHGEGRRLEWDITPEIESDPRSLSIGRQTSSAVAARSAAPRGSSHTRK